MSDWLPDEEFPWQATREPIKCAVCGKEFVRIYKVNARALTCSKACSKARYKRQKQLSRDQGKQAIYAARWKAKHPDYKSPASCRPRVSVDKEKYQAMLVELEDLREKVARLSNSTE